MRLIIDIDDETYKNVTFYGTYLCPRDKENLEKALKNARLIEERAKGKWIDAIDTGVEMLECSVCKCRIKKKSYAESVGTEGYNYCPYCGADMNKGGTT